MRIHPAIRFIFGALCTGLALLTLVEAPTSLLWLAALGVTEWGYWLAPIPLLAWLPGWNDTRLGRIGAGLGLAGAILLMTPLLRAAALVEDWPAGLPPFIAGAAPRSADGAAARPSPLAVSDLLLGVASPAVSTQELVYATKGGQPLALDLYRIQGRTESTTQAPVVVVVHGGSWQHGDRADLSSLNRYLAARGYVVAAVSYRFAPQWPFPAARDDVREAIVFLKAHAAEYGLDPHRIALIGRSAGGQIALSLAYTGSHPDIRGVVAFYAPTDMIYSYEHPSNPWVLDSIGVLEAYLGGNPDRAPAVYEAASPLRFVSTRTVPTVLIHGGRDELVFPVHSERLAARLAQSERPHFFLRLPWATHGCDVHFSGPCGQISTYVIERFLATIMRD